MKQEDKELLLRDLCARLPYGVKAYVKNWSKLDREYYEGVYTVESIHPSLNTILVYSERFSVEVIVGYDDYEIKPYLFPLSSMTEEQKEELNNIFDLDVEIAITHIKNGIPNLFTGLNRLNWFIKNHFDIYGLIPMGLANDATDKNIY